MWERLLVQKNKNKRPILQDLFFRARDRSQAEQSFCNKIHHIEQVIPPTDYSTRHEPSGPVSLNQDIEVPSLIASPRWRFWCHSHIVFERWSFKLLIRYHSHNLSRYPVPSRVHRLASALLVFAFTNPSSSPLRSQHIPDRVLCSRGILCWTHLVQFTKFMTDVSEWLRLNCRFWDSR